MVSYQYSYMIGCIALVIVWAILYKFRKDTRKEMLLISGIFGIAGLFVDPVYFKDWWHPLTITNTMPGIESFIFGFTVGGIASIIYEEVFLKRVKVRKARKKEEIKKDERLFIICFLLAALFFGFFYLLGFNSFYASFPAFFIPIFIIWFKRRDLILDSLFSAVLLTIISFIFYIIPEMITPGWIASAWNFNTISGITILKIPIEDLIWFFLTGLYIGPLYEYWRGGRVVKNSR